eukprot:5811021-Pleurochrysis_carterae.AAC.1
MITSRIGKKSRGGSGFVKKSARLSTLRTKGSNGDLQVFHPLPDKEMASVDVLGPRMVLRVVRKVDSGFVINV